MGPKYYISFVMVVMVVAGSEAFFFDFLEGLSYPVPSTCTRNSQCPRLGRDPGRCQTILTNSVKNSPYSQESLAVRRATANIESVPNVQMIATARVPEDTVKPT